MSPENLSIVILGIVGVIIQFVFMYFPKLKDWYEAQTNKGLIMLAVNVVVAGVYFGLSCTSLAVLLHILLTCDTSGLFTLLQALFIISTGQQLTYLYTRNSKALGTSKKFG